MFFGGLTYSSHPVSLAASLATLSVYEEDDLIGNAARLGPVMQGHHERLAERHPSVGAHRNLGLFGVIELVRSRDPWTPMTPFNGTSDEMKAVGKYLREHGVYTMIANNAIHTNPPLCITEDQLAEGFEVLDAALALADEAVAGLVPARRAASREPTGDGRERVAAPGVPACRGRDREAALVTPEGAGSSAFSSSLVGLVVVWEAVKWLGGDPWRIHATVAGIAIDYEHFPLLKWRIADDLSLPHVWDIATSVHRSRPAGRPAARGGAVRAGALHPGRGGRPGSSWAACSVSGSASCSSTHDSPSERWSRMSSPPRPSRSSPSRRSWSSPCGPTGCR